LKYFEGMKMMNDMMKMDGDLDDMGMKYEPEPNGYECGNVSRNYRRF
jgi:hypothetical protein